MNPLNLKQKLKLPAKYQDNWKLGQALWVTGNTRTCIVGGVYWAALELRAGYRPWEPPWSARNKNWRSPRTGGHHCLTWQHVSSEQSVWGTLATIPGCREDSLMLWAWTLLKMGISLVVQWLILHLPMKGCGLAPWSETWDPTCLTAKKLKHKTEAILQQTQ